MTKKISQLTAAASVSATDILEISQRSTVVTTTASTISALASDNSFNDSAEGFIAAGFAVGDQIGVSGFDDPDNNLFTARITALTAGKMTVGSEVLVNETSGEPITISKWVTRRTTLVAAAGTAAGIVKSVVAGDNVTVDDLDPENPIVSADVALYGGNEFGGAQTVFFATVTGAGPGGVIPINAELSNNFRIILAPGQTSLAKPTGMRHGGRYLFKFIQPGSGGISLGFDAAFLFPGGTAPVLNPAPNGITFVETVYDLLLDQLHAAVWPPALPFKSFSFACSDETTDLEVADDIVTLRIDQDLTLYQGHAGVRASVNDAPTGADMIVDLKVNGVSILSTPITIEAGSTTSVGAAVPPVVSSAFVADNSRVQVSVTQVGSTVPGTGLKISMRGT